MTKDRLNMATRLGELVASLGAVTSAMGCTMCFPAIGSLGAALGMGFLSQWEWTLIETVMPVMAALLIGLQILGWFAHRQWWRSLLGMLGPAILLLSLYPWFQYGWSSYATYTGLAGMLAFSIWDFLWPANRHCSDDTQCSSGP